MELGLNNEEKTFFNLDPRTKIFLLVILSFMVFNDAPFYISGILVLIPFLCLFFSNHKKIAIIYIALYFIAKYIQIYLLSSSTGIIAIISKKSGIFKYINILDIAPPKKSEPTSPIITFALWKL